MAAVLAIAVSVFAIGDVGAPLPTPAPVVAATETGEVASDTPASQPAYTVWDRLALCESTQNWHANTGNGYFGGLQFDPPTWARHGGRSYASRADLASRGQQIAVAERTLAAQGWSAWPACSRRLGLR